MQIARTFILYTLKCILWLLCYSSCAHLQISENAHSICVIYSMLIFACLLACKTRRVRRRVCIRFFDTQRHITTQIVVIKLLLLLL